MSPRNALYATVLSLAVVTLGARAAEAGTIPASPSNGSYSAALLYNQANAYAREGKPGMAVLNYERARLLAPADPDIRANLRYVRETSNLPAPARNWFDGAERLASPAAVYWIGCAGLLLAALSELARRQYPGHRRLARGFMVAGLALMMGTICNAVAFWPTLHEAVVVASIAPVRVAPVTAADVLVTLREAQIVTVEAQRPDFLLVHTDAGRTGWVSRSDVARVVPGSDP
jgi:hypothetical protein